LATFAAQLRFSSRESKLKSGLAGDRTSTIGASGRELGGDLQAASKQQTRQKRAYFAIPTIINDKNRGFVKLFDLEISKYSSHAPESLSKHGETGPKTFEPIVTDDR
jgi:hypothetical protein